MNKRPAFAISIENGTKSELENVVIRFKRSPWRTSTGILGIGAFKQTADEPEMPTIPDTAVLTWADTAGVVQEVEAPLAEEGRIHGPGEYETVTFVVEEPATVRVYWKRY